MTEIKRGDIFYADLRPVVGSEQGGIRPVVIIQNDIGNRYSPTTIVVPLTSRKKKNLPTHEILTTKDAPGLMVDSTVLCECIKSIDKDRIKGRIGKVMNKEAMSNILKACINGINEI